MNKQLREPATGLGRLGTAGLISALAAIVCLVSVGSAFGNLITTSHYRSDHKSPGYIRVDNGPHDGAVEMDISDVGQSVRIETVGLFLPEINVRGTCVHDMDLNRNYADCPIALNNTSKSRRLDIIHLWRAPSVTLNLRNEYLYNLRITRLTSGADLINDGHGNDFISRAKSGDQINAAFGQDEVRLDDGAIVDARDGEAITANTADEINCRGDDTTAYVDYNDPVGGSTDYPAVPGGPLGHCGHVFRDDAP